jgi:hypothetical protein
MVGVVSLCDLKTVIVDAIGSGVAESREGRLIHVQ